MSPLAVTHDITLSLAGQRSLNAIQREVLETWSFYQLSHRGKHSQVPRIGGGWLISLSLMSPIQSLISAHRHGL